MMWQALLVCSTALVAAADDSISLLQWSKRASGELYLKHSDESVIFTPGILTQGAVAWSDRAYTYSLIPEFLEGATFFKGMVKSVPSGSLTLNAVEDGTAYIWAEARRHGGFGQLEGWTNSSEVIVWIDPSGTYPGSTLHVRYRTISANEPITWTVTKPWVGGVGFKAGHPVTSPSTVFGDPHVTNVAGDTFDIVKAAVHIFLLIPRGAKGKHVQLEVRGKVTARGNPCSGNMYLTHLNITGQWLDSVGSLELSTAGEEFNTPEAIGLKFGNSGNLSAEEFSKKFPAKMANVTKLSPQRPTQLNKHVTTLLVRLYLGPTILRLSWEHQKEKLGYSNSLMLLTYGLGSVPGGAGGLLGADEHTWAESKQDECKASPQSRVTRVVQSPCCVRAAAYSSAAAE